MSNAPHKAPDSINTFGIATIGVVSTFLVWASIVALQAYYGATEGELNQERAVQGQAAQVRAVRAEQEGLLNLDVVETVDANKGLVRVPVTYAMKETVLALSADPSATLVPSVGPSDTPTVPAVWGRPQDGAQATPAAPTDPTTPDAPAAPEEGAPAEPATGGTTGGTDEGGAPGPATP